MPQSILYYPKINIQDSRWLRNAALYWDEVCSIVPSRDYQDLSPELQYMQERGQYRPIYPQELFYAHNAGELCSLFLRNLNHNNGRSNEPHLKRSSINRLPTREYQRVYNPNLAELIHYKKLPKNLLDGLIESGAVLAVDGEWLVVDKAFERKYMRLLAEFVAKYDTSDMVIGTDKVSEMNSIYHTFPDANRNDSAIVLTLDNCFPAPAEDTGFERILDFKESHNAELLEFRQKIRAFEIGVSQCATIEEVKFAAATFRESWEIELNDVERMFRGSGIGFTLKTLRTFVADAGAAAGLIQGLQMLGFISSKPSVLGAAIGMSGLIGVGLQHREYRNKINTNNRNSGFAYVIKAYQNGLIRNDQVAQVL